MVAVMTERMKRIAVIIHVVRVVVVLLLVVVVRVQSVAVAAVLTVPMMTRALENLMDDSE